MTAYFWLDDAMNAAIRLAYKTSIRRKVRVRRGLLVVEEVGP